jgi:ABC-type taurine transport system ATPase subunit
MLGRHHRALDDQDIELAGEDGRRLLGSCPPEQTTLLQIIHAFVGYARSHAGDLEGDTAVVVIKALQEAFPCPHGSASATSLVH